jgi:hypothetical protein
MSHSSSFLIVPSELALSKNTDLSLVSKWVSISSKSSGCGYLGFTLDPILVVFAGLLIFIWINLKFYEFALNLNFVLDHNYN